jgi:hypothetical protein
MIRNVTFTCPQTGQRVETMLPDVPEQEASDAYRSVPCPSCGWYRAVHCQMGKLFGQAEEECGDHRCALLQRRFISTKVYIRSAAQHGEDSLFPILRRKLSPITALTVAFICD